MKPLVIIPARGGSKGVTRKNIKPLGDKALILYTLEAAKEVFDVQNICVSTDDAEIKSIVEKAGISVPFLRPIELAADDSGTYEVLLHAIDYYEHHNYFPDTIILLQPTSPFRTSEHIKDALLIFNNESNLEMLVSVKETKANPYFMLFEENQEGFLKKSKEGNFIRRQDCPKVFEFNGAIYIINVEALKKMKISDFKKVRKFMMDERSSHDIDSDLDWKIAEALL